MEQALYKESSSTGVLSEVISHQLDLETVSHGSVVLQLRPITDQAVQTLLNAKHNNTLVKMIYGMLRQVDCENVLNDAEPLKIRVNVCYANSVKGKPGKLPHGLNKIKISLKSIRNINIIKMIKSFYFDLDEEITKADLIKNRMKTYRNDLLHELEPNDLASLLSKSEIFTENDIELVQNAHGCSGSVETLLSLVENGDSQAVEKFVKVLNDLGYSHIVELIDPPDIHNKAGKNLPDIL